METKIYREEGSEWCALKVRLEGLESGVMRLCITGEQGEILSRVRAKRQALDYWESFFEENEEEMDRMRRDYGKRTARGAARFVIESDGEFHGLDVARAEAKRIFVLYSCGQIREELARWFPEAVPFFRWHLNDMHAECEHQEAQGITVSNTSLGTVCQTCGYKLGSAWLSRPLPPEVIAWAKGLCEGTLRLPEKRPVTVEDASCWQSMRCLCWGHASGTAFDQPCDTTER